MTPDYVDLLRESALRDEVFPADMVALCDEVKRCHAGMRQLLQQRAEVAVAVRELIAAWTVDHYENPAPEPEQVAEMLDRLDEADRTALRRLLEVGK